MFPFDNNIIDINKIDIEAGAEASNAKVSELIKAMEPYSRDSRLFNAVDEIRVQMHINTMIIEALYDKLKKQNYKIEEFYKSIKSEGGNS